MMNHLAIGQVELADPGLKKQRIVPVYAGGPPNFLEPICG